jgi:tellurite resistance protein TehA-like permease
MRTRTWWWRLTAAVRDLNPGYLGLVMATGIVARAVSLDGAATLAGFLLALAVIAFVLLVAVYAWRLIGYRRRFLADAGDPRQGFGYFTFAAASNVLAALLAADGHTAAALTLLVLGGAAWLLLSCALPMLLAGRNGARPALAGADGTWFLWAVAAESIAVAATSLHPPGRALTALAALAVTCWGVGVVLYLVIAAMVASALLQYPVRAADLTPPYWIFMGATAIAVLAGAQVLLAPPDPLAAAVRPVIAGLSVVLWAFGTWLIPLLVVLGVWRHLLRRVPLRYEPGLWGIVFPVGMYGVASHELGTALRVSWLVTLGRYEAWLALAVWAIVAAAMVVTMGAALTARRWWKMTG